VEEEKECSQKSRDSCPQRFHGLAGEIVAQRRGENLTMENRGGIRTAGTPFGFWVLKTLSLMSP
jgi:hypothetical protein